jgi:ribosomal 50S subunit-recycling heat shock protein
VSRKPAASRDDPPGTEPQRLDRWLWFARLTKTRAVAASLCETGKVRLVRAGQAPKRVDRASQSVRVGDQLSLVVHGRAIGLQVLGLGLRRGPPAEAQSLYRLLGDNPHSGETPP